MTRPTIFLSGVSREFGAFRDAVEHEVQRKECFTFNQSSFATDYRTVEAMLTRKIEQSDAVIHLVGFRFGFEPIERPAGVARRSYTQMEFDIARRLNKPVYVFLSKSSDVRQPPAADEAPEDEEAQKLQKAHREAVTRTNDLYYYFGDVEELRRLVAGIPVVVSASFRADVGRIDRYAPAELVGRENELALLTGAWDRVCRAERPRPHVLTFVALGGEGKTSLVARWMASLAADGWRGCDCAFGWSFYSQGTKDQSAASGDLFLAEALRFFGDAEMADSPRLAIDKGKRVAELAGQRRALLILDGLEPLQYPPTSPLAGQLKDPGVSALLKSLAARNDGLCVVTTRYSVADLKNYRQTTAPETKIVRLSRPAGVELLRRLGVVGAPAELERLVEDVKGHALTLNLLGKYLHDAHAGDVRKRHLVRLDEADDEEQGGHAFRVMDAYAVWLEGGGEKGRRALALLRLLGLFDRPATADCLAALQQAPVIEGLTEALVGMSEAQRNLALARLEEAQLVTLNRDAGALVSLDAHPLLRDYFARRLRDEQFDPFRAAHRRLYEHLCATTEDKDEPTVEDLQPLYQAVAHGCLAGVHQEACVDVYLRRICQGGRYHATKNLGAYGASLGAIARLFDRPWDDVAPALEPALRSWVLGEAAFTLRALGRLAEASGPMRATLEQEVEQQDWKNAAIAASNLSELELTLGDVSAAVGDAELGIAYADRSGDPLERMGKRARLANALHQGGHPADAEARLREAAAIQAERQPKHPLLYSLAGFWYCDLRLSDAERAAWRPDQCRIESAPLLGACRDVERRAVQTLEWVTAGRLSLLTVAVNHLSLGRAALYAWILGGIAPGDDETLNIRARLTAAVDGLRRAGQQDYLPHGLLSRAWLHGVEAAHRQRSEHTQAADCEALAVADLDEAYEIAERGPMRLHLADVYLYRCRLFHAASPYPWRSSPGGNPRGPKDDLADARRLIEQCGYWRRKEELEDAEASSATWPDAQP